jgi:hypothetical protein
VLHERAESLRASRSCPWSEGQLADVPAKEVEEARSKREKRWLSLEGGAPSLLLSASPREIGRRR